MNNSKSAITEGINISNDIYKLLKNLKEDKNINSKTEKEKGQIELNLIENLLKVIKLKRNSIDNSGLIYIPSRKLEQSISEKLNTTVSTSIINNKTNIKKESDLKIEDVNNITYKTNDIDNTRIFKNEKKTENLKDLKNEIEFEEFDILNMTSIEKNDCNESMIDSKIFNNYENEFHQISNKKNKSNMNLENNALDQTFSTINFDLESKFNDQCSFISKSTTLKMFKSKTQNNLKDIISDKRGSNLYLKMSAYNNISLNNLNNSRDTIDFKGKFYFLLKNLIMLLKRVSYFNKIKSGYSFSSNTSEYLF